MNLFADDPVFMDEQKPLIAHSGPVLYRVYKIAGGTTETLAEGEIGAMRRYSPGKGWVMELSVHSPIGCHWVRESNGRREYIFVRESGA